MGGVSRRHSAIPLTQVEEIPSTSEALKLAAEQGAPEQALLARRQTAGRGRLGRLWQTLDGNLFLSVLIRPAAPLLPGHWSLLAGVALHDTLAPLAPGRLTLKWPNDLLLDGAKLAGILLDAGTYPHPFLVIGFGVNLAAAPPATGQPTASLAPTPLDPAQVATQLLATLQTWRTRYVEHGFEPIRGAWLAQGPRPGDPVSISGQPRGRFRTIAPDGALRLDTPSGPATIVTGDVT